jgi:hypothetical protein
MFKHKAEIATLATFLSLLSFVLFDVIGQNYALDKPVLMEGGTIPSTLENIANLHNAILSSLVAQVGPLQTNVPPTKPWVSIGVNIWRDAFVLFRATDVNGDRLKYKVIFTTLSPDTPYKVFDQTISAQGFNKQSYASGEWGALKIPKDQFPPGMYKVYVQAYDGVQWGPLNDTPRFVILPY